MNYTRTIVNACLLLFSSSVLLAQTTPVQPAAAPPAGGLPTVTPLNSLGIEQVVIDPKFNNLNNVAHKIGLTVKIGTNDLSATILTEGPTFDASAAAQVLLDQLRLQAWKNKAVRDYLQDNRQSYWGLLLMPNCILLDHPFFYKWKRTSGPKNRAQEQRIAAGFVAAQAQQFVARYPNVAKSAGMGSPPISAGHRLRPHYAINGPADFPRCLKPGTVVSFAFQEVNWLKYVPEVESKGYVRQFSLASELSKQDPSPANGSKDGIREEAHPTSDALLNTYQEFNKLKAELTSTYQADYWLDPVTDQKQRETLQLSVFGEGLTAATTFAEKPLKLLKDAEELVKPYKQKVDKATTDVAANKDPKKTKPLKDALDTAIQNQKDLETKLQPLLKDKATIESAEYKQVVTALGDALVKLRTVDRPRPSTTVVLPDDKDEADITIDYKLRPDYKQPPGVGATIAKQSFTIFLLPRFRITGSVGPYYTGLVDHRFSFISDSIPATDPTKHLPRKRIVRDNSDEKFSGVGASAFIHFEYRLSPGFSAGAALGVGAQNDGLRLLLGPSLIFGNSQRIAVSAGFAGGRTIRLAEGYHEGQLLKDPVTSQVPTRVINNTSWFVGLSYNLSSTRN